MEGVESPPSRKTTAQVEGEEKYIPGYTVITNDISAAAPTSSDMAVEGVSKEMATPARIPLAWIETIREVDPLRTGKFSKSGAGFKIQAEEEGNEAYLLLPDESSIMHLLRLSPTKEN